MLSIKSLPPMQRIKKYETGFRGLKKHERDFRGLVWIANMLPYDVQSFQVSFGAGLRNNVSALNSSKINARGFHVPFCNLHYGKPWLLRHEKITSCNWDRFLPLRWIETEQNQSNSSPSIGWLLTKIRKKSHTIGKIRTIETKRIVKLKI